MYRAGFEPALFCYAVKYSTVTPCLASVSFIQASAVSPEIVPAPESHRSVALLISSQSHITFGRSFSCQSSRERNIPQGVRV